MACMGPSINKQKLAEAQAEIRDILMEKYDCLGKNVGYIFPSLMERRKLALEELDKAIEGIFWQEAFETF